jgi:hypothetical protein
MTASASAATIARALRPHCCFQLAVVHSAKARRANTKLLIATVFNKAANLSCDPNTGGNLNAIRVNAEPATVSVAERIFYALPSFAGFAVVDNCGHFHSSTV